MNSEPPDTTIRITKEEATSTQVDDFLKRQMSLRGEPGVTRDHGRRWYYQTWFVFMLVGALGAFAAWAIIEPFFDDMLYLQGPITAINLEENAPSASTRTGRLLESRHSVAGSLTIKGEKIFLFRGARELGPDGSKHRLDSLALNVGQTV